MSGEHPTIGEVIREEIRICQEYEKSHPGMTLDMNGIPTPKRPPSTAQRCDTCTNDRRTCGQPIRTVSRMICCPLYEGMETMREFLARDDQQAEAAERGDK